MFGDLPHGIYLNVEMKELTVEEIIKKYHLLSDEIGQSIENQIKKTKGLFGWKA